MATYDKLILRAKLRNTINEYTEKHHILMKSLGGSNKKSNIVELTAREHYICHVLLYKHYCKVGTEKEILKTALAVSFFNSNTVHPRSKVGKFISREYSSIKKVISSNMVNNNPGTSYLNKGKTMVEIYGVAKAAEIRAKALKTRELKHSNEVTFLHSDYGTVTTTIYKLQHMYNKPSLSKLIRLVNCNSRYTAHGWAVVGKVKPPEKKKQVILNTYVELFSGAEGKIFKGTVEDYLKTSNSIPYKYLTQILSTSNHRVSYKGIMLKHTYIKRRSK